MCPGKFLVAKATGVPHDYGIPANIPYASTHYIWTENEQGSALMGPGWKALVEAYRLVMHDIVMFTFDPETNVFNVEVISGDGAVKEWRKLPGKSGLVFLLRMSTYTSLNTFPPFNLFL